MHIPDGFLSPQTYLPAYAVAGAAWAWAARGLRGALDEQTVPRLAAVTALAYGLGLVMVPIPGGTSGHALGVAMLALLFGVRVAFLAYSLVLALQSLFFGAGGITALAVNALAIGLAGAATAAAAFRLLRRRETAAVAVAAWLSVALPGLLVALVLGAQPAIAQRADGTPLFFPFGLSITLPAVLIPHIFIGAGEAVLTMLVWRFARARRWLPPDAASGVDEKRVESSAVADAFPRKTGKGAAASFWLCAYLAAVVAITFVHEPLWLAAALAAAFVACGAARWRILRRAALAVLAFNLAVSLGYAAVAVWQERFSAQTLLLLNLRVLLLVFLGFWFVARVSLLEACRFSPGLTFVVTLAVGQIQTFARALRDFRLAFVSRNAACPAPVDRARQAAAQAAHLLDKSIAGAAETALAMRSRGAFDD
ncbi:MAG: energy-coupling factor ABC transporter permease [Zoogloeaceae bacterium]|jgi:cobalt/nickel transport system permease protein|nr:energy-coupling factor ABC transporter permease [Zoogloeaceae bacterium]